MTRRPKAYVHGSVASNGQLAYPICTSYASPWGSSYSTAPRLQPPPAAPTPSSLIIDRPLSRSLATGLTASCLSIDWYHNSKSHAAVPGTAVASSKLSIWTVMDHRCASQPVTVQHERAARPQRSTMTSSDCRCCVFLLSAAAPDALTAKGARAESSQR